MEETISRLRMALKAKGLTQGDAAKRLKYSLGQMNKILAGRANIPNGFLELVCEKCNLDLNFVLKGPKRANPPEEKPNGLDPVDLTEEEKTAALLPVFNIDAGYEITYGDEGYEPKSAARHVRYYSDDPHAFTVQFRGDSMEPEYPKGFFGVVEPCRMVNKLDCVVFKLQNGTKSFKQWIPMGNHKIKLHPLNPEHDDLIVDERDIVYKWKVVDCVKGRIVK